MKNKIKTILTILLIGIFIISNCGAAYSGDSSYKYRTANLSPKSIMVPQTSYDGSILEQSVKSVKFSIGDDKALVKSEIAKKLLKNDILLNSIFKKAGYWAYQNLFKYVFTTLKIVVPKNILATVVSYVFAFIMILPISFGAENSFNLGSVYGAEESTISNFTSPLNFQYRKTDEWLFAMFPYLDRTYVMNHLPLILKGSNVVASSNNNKYSTGPVAEFDCEKDLLVWVFYDSRLIAADLIPDFLHDYIPYDLQLKVHETQYQINYLSGYVKTFKKGEHVVLEGNQFGASHYIAFVKDLETPVGGLTSNTNRTYNATTITNDTSPYSDRSNYRFAYKHPELVNATLIQTPNNDKRQSEDITVASFTALNDIYLYISYDYNLDGQGLTLNYFSDNNFQVLESEWDIEINEGPSGNKFLQTYYKFVKKGEVVNLPGNSGISASSNYIALANKVTPLIDNIVPLQGSYDYALSHAANQHPVYTDRVTPNIYSISSLPSHLEGANVLLTPNDNKWLSGDTVSVNIPSGLSSPVDLYLFRQNDLEENPLTKLDLPEGFVDTNDEIVINEGDYQLKTFKGRVKRCLPGETIIFPGNINGGSNYFVLAKTPPDIISDLKTFETSNIYRMGVLYNGMPIYSDRTDPDNYYSLASAPSHLLSKRTVTVHTPNNDKNMYQDVTLSFVANELIDVYVAYDNRLYTSDSIAPFLTNNGFEPILDDEQGLIEVNEGINGSNFLRLFKKTYSAGDLVELGGNYYGYSNYMVFVQSQDASSEMINTYYNYYLKVRKEGSMLYIYKYHNTTREIMQVYTVNLGEYSIGNFKAGDSFIDFSTKNLNAEWTFQSPYPNLDGFNLYMATETITGAGSLNTPENLSKLSLVMDIQDENVRKFTQPVIIPVDKNELTFGLSAYDITDNETPISDPFNLTISNDMRYGIYRLVLENTQTFESLVFLYSYDSDTFTLLEEGTLAAFKVSSEKNEKALLNVPFRFFEGATLVPADVINAPENEIYRKLRKNELEKEQNVLGKELNLLRIAYQKYHSTYSKKHPYLFLDMPKHALNSLLLKEGGMYFSQFSNQNIMKLFRKIFKFHEGDTYETVLNRIIFSLAHETGEALFLSHDSIIPHDIKRLEAFEQSGVDVNQLLSAPGYEFYLKLWNTRNTLNASYKIFNGADKYEQVNKKNVTDNTPAYVILKSSHIYNDKTNLIEDFKYHLANSSLNNNKIIIQYEYMDEETNAVFEKGLIEKLVNQGVPSEVIKFSTSSYTNIINSLKVKSKKQITVLSDHGDTLFPSKVNVINFSPTVPDLLTLAFYLSKNKGNIDTTMSYTFTKEENNKAFKIKTDGFPTRPTVNTINLFKQSS